MTRVVVVFIRTILSMVWVMIPNVATATDQYSAQIIYNACVGSKDNVRAFCFGYLEAAALTWAHAGMRYAAADVTLTCEKGRAIETPDLVGKFIEYVETHPEAKTQLAIQLVFDLVCNERN
jgi:hypothetical protein